MKNRRTIRLIVLAIIMVTALFTRLTSDDPVATGGTSGDAVLTAGEQAIIDAFNDRRSDVIVEASGVIERLLPDDTDGTPHQKFIVRLPSGHTVLISHNTALAPRIPFPDTGQPITFAGEYEWNRDGGVVHWTHHDPRGRHPGGWLEYQGKRYE